MLLMVGFYCPALALAAGLLWIPYAQWRYLHLSIFLTFKVGVFCVGGAGLILISIVPRTDCFTAPGPLLAHEFGHYRGGDTRLGPWVYRTRQAIERTLQALSGQRAILKLPFDWYGRLFLRITQAVSRHQEAQADVLAAEVAGASALVDGLRATHEAALAFAPYWFTEVVPVLSAGFRPPIVEGFARFLEQPRVKEQLSNAEAKALSRAAADPYDSHPSLRDRVAALAGLPERPRTDPDPVAVTLLAELSAMEAELLAAISPSEEVARLQPLPWKKEEVGTRVVGPAWESFLKKHGKSLLGLTPRSLPGVDWTQVGDRVANRLGEESAAKEPRWLAEHALGGAIGVALLRRGWSVVALPGQSDAAGGGVRIRTGE